MYRAQTVEGKKLDAQDLWRRLKVGRVIAVTADHKGLDAVCHAIPFFDH
jgi:hypothetical protein